MSQQFGLTKVGLGIMVTATISSLILLLCFVGMAVAGNFTNGFIAIWYTVATVVCVLSLAGKLVCGFGPDWLGSTTMLFASLILDLLLCASVVCFSLGITIPGVEEQIHHLVTASIFVASTFFIIRWLQMVAENADSRTAMQKTKYADWLFKASLGSSLGIVVAISINAKAASVTGIIAMVLLVVCLLMLAGCLILKIAATFSIIAKLNRL